MISHSYKTLSPILTNGNNMCSKPFQMGLVVTLLATVVAVPSSAQSGCNPVSTSISLSSCLGYMAGGSSTPPASCCAQVDAIAKFQAHCLCWYLGSTATLGALMNQALATPLPGACKVDNPFANQCNAASRSPASSETTADEVPVSPSSTAMPTGRSHPPPLSSAAEPSIPAGSGKTTGQTSAAGASVKHNSMPWVFFLLLFLSAVAALSLF